MTCNETMDGIMVCLNKKKYIIKLIKHADIEPYEKMENVIKEVKLENTEIVHLIPHLFASFLYETSYLCKKSFLF